MKTNYKIFLVMAVTFTHTVAFADDYFVAQGTGHTNVSDGSSCRLAKKAAKESAKENCESSGYKSCKEVGVRIVSNEWREGSSDWTENGAFCTAEAKYVGKGKSEN